MCMSVENRSSMFSAKSITNKELRDYANEITQVVSVGRAARVQLCGIMAEMAQKDIFGQFGGEFGQFVEERLGLKKSQAYDMVRVGATFGIKRENNWKPQLMANGGSWTQTQLMALLPMGAKAQGQKKPTTPQETLERCESLVQRKLIKPSMTVAEIKEVVKRERPDAKAIEDRKVKREQKKLEESKAKEQAAEKLHGKKLMDISIWQLEGGEIHVTFNGEELEYKEDNIAEIIGKLMAAKNYKGENYVKFTPDGASTNDN